MSPGRLWVTATPLGNPGDLSPRASEVLGRAGLILAEDTRRALRLLSTAGICGKRVRSLHEHNESARLPEVLDFIAQGGEAALISDAGTPLLSDPGYHLVRACREAGLPVSPVPGPSAVSAALSVSGLAPYPFTFLGFLPRKAAEIARLLTAHAAPGHTLIFFERKDRLAGTMAQAGKLLGDRDFCVAREMTKTHEEFISGNLGDLSALEREFLGEITVILGPAKRPVTLDEGEVAAIYAAEAGRGGKPREIARRVAARSPGWTAGAVYERFGLKG